MFQTQKQGQIALIVPVLLSDISRLNNLSSSCFIRWLFCQKMVIAFEIRIKMLKYTNVCPDLPDITLNTLHIKTPNTILKKKKKHCTKFFDSLKSKLR